MTWYVALTREVILASRYNTPNLESAKNHLLKNQDHLGANLAKYNSRIARKYVSLLKEHVTIESRIIDKIFNGQRAGQDIQAARENMCEIAKVLACNSHLSCNKIQDLLLEHLQCSLDQINHINAVQHAAALADAKRCSKVAVQIAAYISKKL